MATNTNKNAVAEILRLASPSRVAERLGLAIVRRGPHPTALCPFHTDTDPSLVLYDQDDGPGGRPHFHCYACNAHGDVFHLVQQVLQTSFPEAVAWLATVVGVAAQLPKRSSAGSPRKAVDLVRQKATGFVRALEIYRSRNGPHELRNWLRERSLPEDLIGTGELAYARPHTLTAYLQQASSGDAAASRIDEGLLEDAGMVRPIRRPNDGGGLYLDLDSRLRDFFSDDRVLFSIRDLDGQLVGFAGRARRTTTGDRPKYLFTQKLPRGNLLYRGDVVWARIAAAQKRASVPPIEHLYICEGLVDALRLESLAFNAVALLGSQATVNQIEAIRALADRISGRSLLHVHVFLDRDEAGARGAAKLCSALSDAYVESSFIWPTHVQLEGAGVPEEGRKDPDSILKHLNAEGAQNLISSWHHAAALPVISAELRISPEDVLNETTWRDTSISRRFRAAYRLSRNSRSAELLLDVRRLNSTSVIEGWLSDILAFRAVEQRESAHVRRAREATYIDDTNARLNHARGLAKSGASRGEVPADEAAWRRMDLAATAFNHGFREKLAEQTFEPIEPFDAVLVARDFGKDEARLKAMPCPEELVLQQYMLAELLTERFDAADAAVFSNYVPAVRYYRDIGVTETTGEDGTYDRQRETLSFAYQIDMDVLEGRHKTSNQGMFRPYIECWHEFIRALRLKAEQFGDVYAVRLDLKRYYDRLSRLTVTDVLKGPMDRAILALALRQDEFAEYFSKNRQNLPDKVVDWLCDQSFDFQYYDPANGRIETPPTPSIGIPQGPVLSAWLATVALFPLDAALRKVLTSINGENASSPRAGYARYVDDIFLLADSPDHLQTLRAVAEDAAKALRLDLIQKGDVIPRMTSEEFCEMLSEGKAFVGSGPAQELGLLHLGDGETGFETWYEADVCRSSSLELLSARRLYLADDLEDQLYTAVQAADLRPGELPKVSRWIWYEVAATPIVEPADAWTRYWDIWTRVTARVQWRLEPNKRPWEDPAFFALDGLERLLSSINIHDRRLLPEEDRVRQERIQRLAYLPLSADFIYGFLTPTPNAPVATGEGTKHLQRMFLQRCSGLRWIGLQLSGEKLAHAFPTLNKKDHLNGSLVRAQLTESEVTGQSIYPTADQGESPTLRHYIRRAFIWLHHAIILFGRECGIDQDPLTQISVDLRNNVIDYARQQQAEFYRGVRPVEFPESGSDFLQLLQLWLPDIATDETFSPGIRVRR